MHTGTDVDEELLDEIFTGRNLATRPFARVAVCFDHPHHVLVPQAVYRDELAETMLHAVHPGVASYGHAVDPVTGWQISNVYAVPPSISHWVQQQFPRAELHHAHSIGIRTIEATNFEGSLSASFRAEDFELLVSKANKLLLAETYPYSTPADVIYTLLEVCRQFSFSQETVRVAISGLIEKESALYRELYQYFLNVRFREPSWTLVSSEESPYPPHFFTPLNDLAKCAS